MSGGLDDFTHAYVETALWASVDEDGDPLGLDLEDIPSLLAPHTLAEMREDCDGFRALAGDLLDAFDQHRVAGDFWLTRNRHGAGFQDGPYPEPARARLTEIAHSFGSCDLYLGDDGLIHSI